MRPLLFLSPRPPWPLNTGAKIRTHALLESLQNHFDVHYAGFHEPDTTGLATESFMDHMNVVALFPERATRPAGKAWLALRTLADPRPVTIAKYWDPRLAAAVTRWRASHPGGIIHADHLHMAPYLTTTRTNAPGTPAPDPPSLRVMDEHNVESVIIERLAAETAYPLLRPYLRLQAARMRAFERAMVERADLTLAVSDSDADRLRQMAPRARVEVIPNGVNLGYFSPPPDGRAPRPGRLLFTGSMNWQPNQDAMLFFTREILPLLDRDHPRAFPWSLDIVGLDPPPPVRALASPRVRVTGTVPDVRPYMHEALIYVVPLRIGGGSRLKILEAFSMGIPVVSTRVGCEGLGAVDEEHLLVADTPEAFARAVARLADQPALRDALASRARAHVQKNFAWPAIATRLVELYKTMQS